MRLKYSVYERGLNKLLLLHSDPGAENIRVYGVKKPNVLSNVTNTATTISFTHNASAADHVEDSADGFGTFKAGDAIRVDNGTNDGKELLVATVESDGSKMTFHSDEIVTTEAVGTSITISTVAILKDEYNMAIIALAAYRVARNNGHEKTELLRGIAREEIAALASDSPVTNKYHRMPHLSL